MTNHTDIELVVAIFVLMPITICILFLNYNLTKRLEASKETRERLVDYGANEIRKLTGEINFQAEKIERYKQREKHLRHIIAESKNQIMQEVIAYEKLLSLIEAQQKSITEISKLIESLKTK